ncbi:MAG: WYL domain-containing protein [Alphaproteobacteria bacterium]|nr:WYL domain-containing protein [Alphaproteobacteria bacterium]
MKTAARRDRLLNLLYRRPTTVPAVARALGVSERTVYRDIASLRDAGHDIHATPGPGGGVRIAPDGRPRAVHFEVAEIIGLALSVAILKATPHMPFAGSAEAALDRARMALSPERRRAMKKLERRILVGAPSSERVRRSLGEVDDTLLSVFERCFTGSRSMAFDYVDAAGATSSRHVECIALVLHAPTWYILAWDLDKDASRTFRMDRIAAPTCGDALVGHHPLVEVMAQARPEARSADDVWNRRPIG